jgi:hypothetical protein
MAYWHSLDIAAKSEERQEYSRKVRGPKSGVGRRREMTEKG